MIYAGLVLVRGLSGWRDPMLPQLLWVVFNLAYSARESHQWYKDKFGSDYPASRRAMVPWLF